MTATALTIACCVACDSVWPKPFGTVSCARWRCVALRARLQRRSAAVSSTRTARRLLLHEDPPALLLLLCLAVSCSRCLAPLQRRGYHRVHHLLHHRFDSSETRSRSRSFFCLPTLCFLLLCKKGAPKLHIPFPRGSRALIGRRVQVRHNAKGTENGSVHSLRACAPCPFLFSPLPQKKKKKLMFYWAAATVPRCLLSAMLSVTDWCVISPRYLPALTIWSFDMCSRRDHTSKFASGFLMNSV